MSDWYSDETKAKLERQASQFLKAHKRRGHKPRQNSSANSLRNQGPELERQCELQDRDKELV